MITYKGYAGQADFDADASMSAQRRLEGRERLLMALSLTAWGSPGA